MSEKHRPPTEAELREWDAMGDVSGPFCCNTPGCVTITSDEEGEELCVSCETGATPRLSPTFHTTAEIRRLRKLAEGWLEAYLNTCHDDSGWEQWRDIDDEQRAEWLSKIHGEEWTAEDARKWWDDRT